MRAEGTRFVTECEVGVDLTVEQLRARYDAVVLAVGALRARDNDVEGRELNGRAPGDGAPGAGQQGVRGRRTVAPSRPRASMSSSSAAATPAPTAWAPPTARARRRSPSSTTTPNRPSSATTRGHRGRRGRWCCAPGCHPPTPRAGTGATRWPCSGSSATGTGNLRALEIAEVRVERRRRRRQAAHRPGRRDAGDPVRAGACWRSGSTVWSTCRCSTGWG